MIHDAKQWHKYVTHESKLIVLVDDIFGKSNLETAKVDEWVRCIEMMQSFIRAGNVHVIITIRRSVKSVSDTLGLGVGYSRLFMGDRYLLDLSSKMYDLTQDEKRKLLNAYLSVYPTVSLSAKSQTKLVRSHFIECAFQQLVTLFFTIKAFHFKGFDFFKQGISALRNEIEEIRDKQKLEFIVLVYALTNDGVVDIESVDTEKLEQICTALSVNETISISAFRDITEKLSTKLCAFLCAVQNGLYEFQHESVREQVLKVFCKSYPGAFLNIVDSRTVWVNARSHDSTPTSEEFFIKVPRDHYKKFASILVKHKEYDFGHVIQHKSSNDPVFASYLVDALEEAIPDNECISTVFSKVCVSAVEMKMDRFAVECFRRFCTHCDKKKKLSEKCVMDSVKEILNHREELKLSFDYISTHTVSLRRRMPLFSYACLVADPTSVLELVNRCEKYNLTDVDQKTIIHFCIERVSKTPDWDPDYSIITRCLQLTPDLLNMKEGSGLSPIIFAWKAEAYKIVHVLLSFNPCISDIDDLSDSVHEYLDHQSSTSPFQKYCPGVVKKLLRINPAFVHHKNTNDEIPIETAARKKDENIYELLTIDRMHEYSQNTLKRVFHFCVKNGWSEHVEHILYFHRGLVNEYNDEGQPPLISSCISRHIDVINVLLRYSANPALHDIKKRSFLHYLDLQQSAGVKSIIDIVCLNPKLLLEKDLKNKSPILISFLERRKFVASLFLNSLLENGLKEVWQEYDKFNRTLLHISAMNGWVDMIDHIVAVCPESIRMLDVYKRTPLMCAALKGNGRCKRAVCKLLFHYKTPLHLCVDQDGNHLLYYCVLHQWVDIAEAVLDKDVTWLFLKNNDGESPIEVAKNEDEDLYLALSKYNREDILTGEKSNTVETTE